MKQIKTDPTKTVLTICVGFILVFLYTKWEGALTIAAIIGLGGVCSSFFAEKIDFLWMKLAWVLSLIIPNILLSLIYFLLLVPIAFFARIFGKKDPLFLKDQDKSTFKEYKKVFDKQSFENPW